MTAALIPGRHYALIRDGGTPDRARISVVLVHDAGTYSPIWSGTGTPESAASQIAAAGWEQDGEETLSAPLGTFVLLRRSGRGRPGLGPRTAITVRVPDAEIDDLVRARVGTLGPDLGAVLLELARIGARTLDA